MGANQDALRVLADEARGRLVGLLNGFAEVEEARRALEVPPEAGRLDVTGSRAAILRRCASSLAASGDFKTLCEVQRCANLELLMSSRLASRELSMVLGLMLWCTETPGEQVRQQMVLQKPRVYVEGAGELALSARVSPGEVSDDALGALLVACVRQRVQSLLDSIEVELRFVQNANAVMLER